MQKKGFFLILILSLAIILRTAFLNEIPPGFIHDEIPLALNAQSLIQTGQPIPGTLTGITGKANGDFSTSIFAEYSSMLLIPWVKLFGLSWPYIKIPFIILNLGLLLVIFLISKKLFNNKIALISGFLFAVNPWSIQMGRTLYEYISFAYYYLAIYISLLELTVKKYIGQFRLCFWDFSLIMLLKFNWC
jgi:hypothetical protein